MALFDAHGLETKEEREFRTERLARDSSHAAALMLFMMIPVIGFVLADLQILRGKASLPWLLGARSLIVALSLALAYRLRQVTEIDRYDRLVAIWSAAMILLFIAISATRPPEYLPVYFMHSLVVLGAYLLLPATLRTQTLAALGMTLGEVGLWFFFKQPEIDGAARMAIFAAFVLTNLFGFTNARRLHQVRRLQFVLGRRQRRLIRELDNALAEVKVLQGMIPICSFCKKVRTDEGYFEEVERYLSRHSEVRFSHTFCEECGEEHYPEIFPAADPSMPSADA